MPSSPLRSSSLAPIDSRTGVVVLSVGHVVGMLDMVALPVWVGSLMRHYGYSAPQAGMTVTAFLVAVAVASLWLAPRFQRLPAWANANLGFVLSAIAFGIVATRPVNNTGMAAMAALHALAGLGVGCALSITHGCIGLSANPHRLFAMVNVALGLFAIGFLAAMPPVIEAFGPASLFMAFAGAQAIAAVAALIGFPSERAARAAVAAKPARLPGAVWLVGGTVVCLTLNQAMVFSFLERIGADRGFAAERVQLVLVALGVVNLLPGLLATWLQRRLKPLVVGMAGPAVQAALALTMSNSTSFAGYMTGALPFVSVVIFTHTFLIGLLSRLDPTGRVVAATPAMMMLGSCTGPALGGAVVHALGYPGLGWVAVGVSAIGMTAMVFATLSVRDEPRILAATGSAI